MIIQFLISFLGQQSKRKRTNNSDRPHRGRSAAAVNEDKVKQDNALITDNRITTGKSKTF